MKKTLIAICMIATILLATSMISAASLTVSNIQVNPNTVNHDAGTFTVTFDLTNTGDASPLDYSVALSQGTATFTYTPGTIALGTSNNPTIIHVTATANFPANQNGNIAGTITIDPTQGSGDSKLVPFSIAITEKKLLEVSPPTTMNSEGESSFTITNNGNVALNPTITIADLTYDSSTLVFTTDDTLTLIQPGDSQLVKIFASIPSDNKLLLGKSTTVTITAGSLTETKTLNLETTYCIAGEIGDLTIRDISITNNGKYGDKDEWYLLDEIEVEVEVKNNHNDDNIDDVQIEWILYDTANGNIIFEGDEDLGRIKDGDTETVTFKFTLDPKDFEPDFSEDDFVLFVKAYSDDTGEDTECASEKDTGIKILRDKHWVIIDDIALMSDSTTCNNFLEGEFDTWNIGDSDEQDIYVMITNSELGISEKVEVGDLDILDDKKSVKFSVNIPSDAKEKSYVLKFTVYDEDDDIYLNDNDDESTFNSDSFTVSGNCAGTPSDVEIIAELDSETPTAVPGKQIIVKATLINKGDLETTYATSVEGISSWASLVSISPQTVTLGAGQTQEVNIILNINDDAEGNQEFTIKASSGAKTSSQKMAISIASKDAQASNINQHLQDNWFIYVIILVNLVLIIAIILVIRRMVAPAPM